jgi:hypothetical protein
MKHDERGEPESREPTPCEWTGTAAAFLMGSIEGTAMRSFLQHVDAGCVACRAELSTDRETLAYLDATELWNDPNLHAPRPALYDAIRVRLAGGTATAKDSIQRWKGWSAAGRSGGVPALHTLKANDGEWQTIDVEGIR